MGLDESSAGVFVGVFAKLLSNDRRVGPTIFLLRRQSNVNDNSIEFD